MFDWKVNTQYKQNWGASRFSKQKKIKQLCFQKLNDRKS